MRHNGPEEKPAGEKRKYNAGEKKGPNERKVSAELCFEYSVRHFEFLFFYRLSVNVRRLVASQIIACNWKGASIPQSQVPTPESW